MSFTVIGTYRVLAVRTVRNSYEFARWFDDVQVPPGTYEVRRYHGQSSGIIHVMLKGRVVASNRQACFGGVPMGGGGIDENIGEEMEVSQMHYPYQVKENPSFDLIEGWENPQPEPTDLEQIVDKSVQAGDVQL